MTDRHAGYVVVLAEDIREDNAAHILNAIMMIKGVLGVVPVVASSEVQIAKMRAEQEIRELVYKALNS